ncbi:MAG: NAD(P)H-dependent oxidoreductase [Roseiflexaceae bacterium]|nr:NAD(P)H-dependent oxidoreductase [Roseiflexaceae bacterium]
MPRVLILFAHPALEKSRAHARFIQHVPPRDDLTFHDLYEAYPTFDIDVRREQHLLIDHEIVVLQCPFFWYSTPALVKQWEDLVLEHGWAYGSQGKALVGKSLLCLLTAGGGAAAYTHEGYNRFTIRELLAPLEQTTRLCNMRFLPPYVVHGTHRLNEVELDTEAQRYRLLLDALCDGRIDLSGADQYATFNAALDTLAQEVLR